MAEREGQKPSAVSGRPGLFDRFADTVSNFTAKSKFFVFCVLIIVIWAPSYFVVGNVDTWQLLINTPTTVITFLLVALIQNTQSRSDTAVHAKLNAIADALADLMETQGLDHDVEELREAVGLEKRQSSGEDR